MYFDNPSALDGGLRLTSRSATQQLGLQGMFSASQDQANGGGLGGQLWAFYRNNRFSISSLNYYSKDYAPGIGLELLDTNYVMDSLITSVDLRSTRFLKFVRSFNPGVSAFSFRSSDNGVLLFAYAPIRPFRM